MREETYALESWRARRPFFETPAPFVFVACIAWTAAIANVIEHPFAREPEPGLTVAAPLALVTTLFISLIVGCLTFRRTLQGGILVPGRDRIELRNAYRVKVLPHASIVAGFRSGTSSLTLRQSDGGVVELSFAPGGAVEEQIGAVLRSVGFGNERRRAMQFPLRSPQRLISTFLSFFGGFFLAVFIAVAIAPHARVTTNIFLYSIGIALFIAGTSAFYVSRKTRLTAVIGDDEVRQHGLFDARRFSYEAFDDVRFGSGGVSLVKDDEVVHTFIMAGMPAAQITAAGERIRSAKRRGHGDATETGSLLARSFRSVDEWRARLRSHALGTGGFRNAALTSEEIARVLANPIASPDQRVGAALALREITPIADAQMHIRIAAEASADPDIRRALEAAAADEVDADVIDRTLEAAGMLERARIS